MWEPGFGRGRCRGWGRGRVGPWPGRGPFSYLPPWQRPGWPRGRRCRWWYMYPPYLPYVQAPQQPPQPTPQPTQQPPAAPYYPLPPFAPLPPTPEQEIEALKAYKVEIEEDLKGIEARIKEQKESLTKESGGQPPETEK